MPEEIVVIFPAEAQPLEVNFEEREVVVEFPPSQVSGLPGKTAYELAVENGFDGSESDWLSSLVGPQGVQGPPGPPEIGGYPIVTAEITDGDLVQFNGGAWKNAAQNNITDGGNF